MMTGKKFLSITIAFLFAYVNAIAQPSTPSNFKFKTYTTQDGLADNTILKLVKDKRGFLWIATHNGISRFDGLHFKNYSHNPADTTSLRSIWATDLIIDANKTLWATTEKGVCWYDETFDRFRYINTPQEIQLIYKAPLCSSPDGSLWVAAENGLKKIDIIRKTFTPTALNRIPDPQSAICNSDGHILIGTRGFGLFFYDTKYNTTKRLQLPGVASNEHVMSFHKDDEGIWAATSTGLLLIKNYSHAELYTSGAGPLKGQSFEQLMCINSFAALTGANKLVCGTYDKKFLLFDKAAKQFIYQWQNETTNPDNVPRGIFYCLYAEENTFWAGTDYGVCKLNLAEQDFVTLTIPQISIGKNLPLVKKILPAAQNKSQYWMTMAPPYGGLIMYDAAEKKVITALHTANAAGNKGKYRLYADLIAAKSGSMYALSDSWLDIFSAAGQPMQSFALPLQPYCMAIDDEQNVWIGTASGLIYINTNTGKQVVYNCTFKGTEVENSSFPESFRTVGVYCGNNDIIWLTSIKYGLFSFNRKTGMFTTHRQPFTGSYETLNRCTSVVPKEKNIWVGTMSGITCYDTQKNTFTNYNSSHGLQSTYVYSLDKDRSNTLWGRGNAGVFSFDPNTKKFVNYNLPLAVLGSFYYQKISPVNDGIAVGFEGGYTLFSKPEQQGNVLPKPIITNCKLLAADYYFSKDSVAITPVIFDYEQNTFQFQFEAIQFNHPQDVTLHYMLKGIDKTWIASCGNNTVSYANLPGGNYSFKVMAGSTSGLRNDIPAVFLFTITPPYWRTWWFRLVMASVAIGSIFFLFRYRVALIKNREQQKTAINKTVAELEMKTLRSRMNPHFIFNSLNSIQKFIWENKKDDASDYLSKFAKLIRLILDHSAQSYITLSEELDALKVYIELEHRRCNGKFEYAITVGENVDANHCKIPPLILQPFVENAIWHGLSPLQNKNGVLSVTIQNLNNGLVCSISDNGIGRKKAGAIQAQSSISRKSVGMDITRQRLEQINRETPGNMVITINDLYEGDNAAGTNVVIFIPVTNEHL